MNNTLENLNTNSIIDSFDLLCPNIVDYDLLVYACTSGSIRIGDKNISTLINKSFPKIRVITFAPAIISAIANLKINNLQLITPYLQEVNDDFIKFLNTHSIDVIDSYGMNINDDYEISNVQESTIYNITKKMNNPKSECIFISCTNLKSIGVIKQLERELKKPIITSHQILLWYLGKVLQFSYHTDDYGTLMKV